MNTKFIDYTGCNEQIARALKKGEMIECWVWDNKSDKKSKTWVRDFDIEHNDHCYIEEHLEVYFRYAEPIDSWFPEPNEAVLCWNEEKFAFIFKFIKKEDDNYRAYDGCEIENIRRVIYPNDTDTTKAVMLVGKPIKEWPEAPEGDINP